jgi:hypothetical protein
MRCNGDRGLLMLSLPNRLAVRETAYAPSTIAARRCGI